MDLDSIFEIFNLNMEKTPKTNKNMLKKGYRAFLKYD